MIDGRGMELPFYRGRFKVSLGFSRLIMIERRLTLQEKRVFMMNFCMTEKIFIKNNTIYDVSKFSYLIKNIYDDIIFLS